MAAASPSPITTPTHPALAALHRKHGKALFWRGPGGAEALVIGERLVACRPGGTLHEGVVVHRGGAPRIGVSVRALLEGRVLRSAPARGNSEVFIAYSRAGKACCWSRDRAVAGRSAERKSGFVKRFLVPAFSDHTGPVFGGPHGIPEHLAPPWRKSDHPRGGTTEVASVLLPKRRFPTKASAARWLRAQPKPFLADRIEDSGKKRPGNYWRARQFDPRPGVRRATIPFGDKGIKAVIEAKGPRKAAA